MYHHVFLRVTNGLNINYTTHVVEYANSLPEAKELALLGCDDCVATITSAW